MRKEGKGEEGRKEDFCVWVKEGRKEGRWGEKGRRRKEGRTEGGRTDGEGRKERKKEGEGK